MKISKNYNYTPMFTDFINSQLTDYSPQILQQEIEKILIMKAPYKIYKNFVQALAKQYDSTIMDQNQTRKVCLISFQLQPFYIFCNHALNDYVKLDYLEVVRCLIEKDFINDEVLFETLKPFFSGKSKCNLSITHLILELKANLKEIIKLIRICTQIRRFGINISIEEQMDTYFVQNICKIGEQIYNCDTQTETQDDITIVTVQELEQNRVITTDNSFAIVTQMLKDETIFKLVGEIAKNIQYPPFYKGDKFFLQIMSLLSLHKYRYVREYFQFDLLKLYEFGIIDYQIHYLLVQQFQTQAFYAARNLETNPEVMIKLSIQRLQQEQEIQQEIALFAHLQPKQILYRSWYHQLRRFNDENNITIIYGLHFGQQWISGMIAALGQHNHKLQGHVIDLQNTSLKIQIQTFPQIIITITLKALLAAYEINLLQPDINSMIKYSFEANELEKYKKYFEATGFSLANKINDQFTWNDIYGTDAEYYSSKQINVTDNVTQPQFALAAAAKILKNQQCIQIVKFKERVSEAQISQLLDNQLAEIDGNGNIRWI